MPIYHRDRSIHLDAIALLGTMNGPVAEALASHHATILETTNEPLRSSNYTTSDRTSYVSACRERLDLDLVELQQLAVRVAGEVLLGVPILLGQLDLTSGTISTGPNAFAYEIELLSGVATGASNRDACGAPAFGEPSDTRVSAGVCQDAVRDAIECLVLARRICLQAHQLLVEPNLDESDGASAKRSLQILKDGVSRGDGVAAARDSLAKSLATTWLFTRGRFSGAYDSAVADYIYRGLRERSHFPDDPRDLCEIASSFRVHWCDVFNEFVKRVRHMPDFESWLREPILINHREFTDAELDTIIEFLPRIWLDEVDLNGGGAGASAWLKEISGPFPVVPRELDPFNVSTLRNRPLVRSHGRVLLVAPHRLETDITDLLNDSWGFKYKEAYYKSRAAAVETIAFATLIERLPGAEGIAAGKYSEICGGIRIEGETDGLVVWNRALFIIEAKGGFLARDARRGAREATYNSLANTIGEAYFQATRLLEVLRQKGKVRLTGPAGERFELSLGDVDRAHVIIPTADDFGNIATSNTQLSLAGILPVGAAPLIVAGQELLLLFDLLKDPIDIAAYFLFREEILTSTEPLILMIDEQEIAGSYIYGTDIVAFARGKMRHSRLPELVCVQAGGMQKYVDAWLFSRQFGESVAPPSRHGPEVQRVAQSLADRGDHEGAAHVLRAGAAQAEEALRRACHKPGVSADHDITVITAAGALSPTFLRKRLREGRPRRTRQAWVVKPRSDRDRVMLTGVHSFQKPEYPFELLRTVNPEELQRWYESAAARRRRQRKGGHDYDEAQVASLSQLGLSDEMSRGVCGAGMVRLVQDTTSLGVDIKKAAAFWLERIKPIATERDLSVSELGWTAEDTAAVLGALSEGKLGKANVKDFVCRCLDDSVNAADRLCAIEAPKSLDLETVHALVSAVLDAEPALVKRAQAGEELAVRALTGKVMRLAPTPKPKYQLVEKVVQDAAGQIAGGVRIP